MNPNNPFGIIMGPNDAPHSVSLKTSFLQKIANTFRVLNGKLPIYDNDDWVDKIRYILLEKKFEQVYWISYLLSIWKVLTTL